MAADILSNLALHWKFTEGTGTDVADSSGNGLNGTLVGTPTWLTGLPNKGGGGIQLNGTSQYVTRAAYTLPTTGTLSIWCKPNTGAESNDRWMVCHGDWNGGTLQLRKHGGSNTLYGGFEKASGTYRVGVNYVANYVQNAWQHYALTWTSGGLLTFYRNGISLGTVNPTTTTTNNSSALNLGSYDGGGAYYSGDAADLRIYSRALTAEDVLDGLYAAGAGLQTKLVSHWKLDETSTGNRLDAHAGRTLSNFNNVTGSASGKIGYCSDFTRASSQTLYRSSEAAFQIGANDYSISCWVMLKSKPAGVVQCFVGKLGGSSTEYQLYYYQTTDRFEFAVCTSASYGGTSSITANTLGSPALDTWYHLVATHKNGVEIAFYINGVLQGTDAHTGGIYAGGDQFVLSGNVGSQYINGYMDETSLFKGICLDAAQVAWLYNGGTGRTYDSYGDYTLSTLLIDWPMQEFIETSQISDVSGNANHGTLEYDDGTDVTANNYSVLSGPGGDLDRFLNLFSLIGVSFQETLSFNADTDPLTIQIFRYTDSAGGVNYNEKLFKGVGSSGIYLNYAVGQIWLVNESSQADAFIIPLNESWCHLAFVFNGDGTIVVYKDGVSRHSGALATTTTMNLTGIATSNNSRDQGRCGLKIYEEARTQAQIEADLLLGGITVPVGTSSKIPRGRLANLGISGPMTRASLIQ